MLWSGRSRFGAVSFRNIFIADSVTLHSPSSLNSNECPSNTNLQNNKISIKNTQRVKYDARLLTYKTPGIVVHDGCAQGCCQKENWQKIWKMKFYKIECVSASDSSDKLLKTRFLNICHLWRILFVEFSFYFFLLAFSWRPVHIHTPADRYQLVCK